MTYLRFLLIIYLRRRAAEKMLYEHVVNIERARAIELSECYENSTESVANMENYLLKFNEMLDILRQNSHSIQKQPLFEWNGRNSSSFMFEQFRIKHTLHKMLMKEAKKAFVACEFKKAHQLLTRAVVLCKEMFQADFVKTPYVRGMPELQKEHALALLLRTKATYCYNLHMQKTTSSVALMSYKLAELSNAVWKRGANPAYAAKLKAHYHFAVASTAEDPQVALNHATLAVSLHQDANFAELHEEILQKNEQIHFLTPEDIAVPLYSLAQGLAKC
jgi:hypothetical protein